jgi:pimeloyl-ACP methyl ester carboxylesterase
VTGLVVGRPAWLGETVPERLRIYLDVADLLQQHGADTGLQRLLTSERYRRVASESPDNAASMRSFFQRDLESTVALLGRLPAQSSGVSIEQMAGLSLPTLVIANERDYVHPLAMATEVAELIPGATLAILPAKDVDREGYVAGFKAALGAFLSGRDLRPVPA